MSCSLMIGTVPAEVASRNWSSEAASFAIDMAQGFASCAGVFRCDFEPKTRGSLAEQSTRVFSAIDGRNMAEPEFLSPLLDEAKSQRVEGRNRQFLSRRAQNTRESLAQGGSRRGCKCHRHDRRRRDSVGPPDTRSDRQELADLWSCRCPAPPAR